MNANHQKNRANTICIPVDAVLRLRRKYSGVSSLSCQSLARYIFMSLTKEEKEFVKKLGKNIVAIRQQKSIKQKELSSWIISAKKSKSIVGWVQL